MAEVDSPTVARRRVRLSLREARKTTQLTQQQVAEEMEWSLSKVIRIENGDVSISPNDLRPLLNYLGIRDRALIADAKVALRPPAHATALTGSFEDIPQDPFGSPLEALPTRPGSLRYDAVFDESVFMRTTGGPVAFAAQLRELQQLADKDLLHFWAEGSQVLYRENGFTDEMIEDNHSTSRHLARFAQLWDAATDEPDTIGFVHQATCILIRHVAIPLPDHRSSDFHPASRRDFSGVTVGKRVDRVSHRIA